MKWPDGTSYTGEWQGDEFNGKGTYRESDGTVYQGQFKDGVPEGEGLLAKAGVNFHGVFKEGMK